MPDFFDVVRRQRACRSFTDEPVTDEVLERVLAAATFAPSAENRQPWEFVVVRDPGLRARIGEVTREAWRGGGREYSRPRLSPAVFADVERGAEGAVSAAPVLVVASGDGRRGNEAAMPASIYPAVQNLLLAATAVGLGSALTTLPVTSGRELAGLLGLPSEVRPYAVVPLGHPRKALGPPRRDPIGAHLHRDRWGQAW